MSSTELAGASASRAKTAPAFDANICCGKVLFEFFCQRFHQTSFALYLCFVLPAMLILVGVAQAEALDQQTTKVKKLQEDLAQKDGRTRAQLEEQIAKESSAVICMQVYIC